MRSTVIVCSLVSMVCVILLGGFLNALSSFGFDYAIPYNSPYRVVATLIGAAPGIIVGLVGVGFALYDAARRGGAGWFIGLLAWPVVPMVASGLMFTGVLAHADLWFVALAVLPMAALVYALTFPSTTNAPAGGTAAATSRFRLAAFVGVLALVALGGAALLLPRAQNRHAVSPGPPPLRVTQNGSTADCAGGTFPTITLTNTGRQSLLWMANTQDPNVTATPSGSILAPEASVTVSLSGMTSAPDVIVQFRMGNQTIGVAKFGCQSGASK